MNKLKNIFKCFIIVLLLAASLSGIKVIEVNAGDLNDPYGSISNYGMNH